MKKIFYGSQYIDNTDIMLVSKALREEKITQGNYVKKFEKSLSKKLNSKFCLSFTNGSSALFSAMKVLNLKKNSTVVTTPISFVATANCIELTGSKTKFIDINKSDYNLDINKLEDFLKKKNKVSAVISVDYAGHPNDWSGLNYLSKKYRFKLINDSCHSLGSKIDNDLGYAVKFADFTTYSFHPVKGITTGEGGAVLTNSKFYNEKLSLIRNNYMKKNDNMAPWFYSIDKPGYNFRLSDINCALGLSQLSKLDFFIKKRRKIADIYNNYFLDSEFFVTPKIKKNIYHSFHLYPLLIDFKKLKIDKKNFFLKSKDHKIFYQVHYIPIYRQPYYKKKYKLNINDFPNSENFYKKEVSLPIHPSLSVETIKIIVKSIFKILK